MIPYWKYDGAELHQGHVLDKLGGMAAGSVHCVVTSPPYWGLRDYGLPPLEWGPVSYAPMAGLPEIEIPGCETGCEHVWGETLPVNENYTRWHTLADYRTDGGTGKRDIGRKSASHGQYCQLCGGWRGCLGLEPTVEMFVGHIVLVARELWRVLREDGTFWLNFGDSYASSGQAGGLGSPTWHGGGKFDPIDYGRAPTPSALKPKDLIGIPWRVAFALQAEGWYLRSDIIWAKGVSFCPTYSGSCMPESVTDRPTKGHEYVFLLSKNARYFYDGDAVRESCITADDPRNRSDYEPERERNVGGRQDGYTRSHGAMTWPSSGRNLRTVWTINPGSYAGAHFATFSPALVEPMIRAGASAKGCCPECGAPWERVTERQGGDAGESLDRPKGKEAARAGQGGHGTDTSTLSISGKDGGWNGRGTKFTTTGWIPTCSCDAGEPVPCTVLDPFAGSGTTLEVAIRLGRRCVGIELSQPYCDDHIIPRLETPIQPVLFQA